MFKVISLVPSWTETLIQSGVNVVGRTRFCIHPRLEVMDIPIVGGTKDIDWGKVKSLEPDFIIMDKEENTYEMALGCPFPLITTHVEKIQDMPRELEVLATELNCEKLRAVKVRWEKIISTHPKNHIIDPPGLIEFVRRDNFNSTVDEPLRYEAYVYVIWKHPWMAATANTFIGSIFKWLGLTLWGENKYPEFRPEDFVNTNALFLCSSEPYPFLKKKDAALELPGDVAIIDGECLSWFGVRSLEYLESLT